ncbi:hypothetical protein STENM223S_02626 [Streptomyces tendae]
MGHPRPFHLTHIAVGNEENLPREFCARFQRFRAAVEAEHPDITVISNSGLDEAGTVFDTAWQLNREGGVDMVDEHYYNSPQWFLRNNDRYDSYDRQGLEVFLGEYASQGNAWRNALAEAAYMTGLERNADVVKLASYAPLLATQSAVEQAVDGGKSTLISKPGSIETGRAYDIEIKVRGRQVTLYLDGQEWGRFTDDKPAEPFRQVVTEDTRTGDLIVKVVNAQPSEARTAIDLGGARVSSRARVTTLAADADAVNTETDAPVTPVTSTFRGVADRFTYAFAPHSVTFMRIDRR